MNRKVVHCAVLGAMALLAGCTSGEEAGLRSGRSACVGEASDSVPLLLDGRDVAVAGLIDGRSVNLEVDTGEPATNLLDRVAAGLNLQPDRRRVTVFVGKGPPARSQNARLRSLQIGRQGWMERSVVVRPYNSSDREQRRIDGVLGIDLIRDAELEIDMPGRRIAFHPSGECRAEAPPWPVVARVPLQAHPLHLPVVMAGVNGKPVRALIRSGFNTTMMTRSLADQLGLPAAEMAKPTVRLRDGEGTLVMGYEVRLDELAVGAEALRNMRAVIIDGPLSGGTELVLGQDWLSRCRLWMSFGSRLLFLAKSAGQAM